MATMLTSLHETAAGTHLVLKLVPPGQEEIQGLVEVKIKVPGWEMKGGEFS